MPDLWLQTKGASTAERRPGTQASISQALGALSNAGGGTLLLGPGNYSLTGSLSVPSNTTFRMASGATLQAVTGFPGSTPMITIGDGSTAVSNVTIRGGKLDGNSLAHRVIHGTGPNRNIQVIEVEATGTSGAGSIEIEGVSVGNPAIGIVVRGCYVHDVFEGIEVRRATEVSITHNRVQDMNVGSSQDGIEVQETTRFVIAHNVVRNPGNSNSCIDVFEDCHDGVVIGNVCSRATGNANSSAINIGHNTTAPSRVIISDNVMTGGFGTAIPVQAPAAEINIDNNLIHDIDAGGGSGKGLELGTGSGTASHIKVRGNTILRTADYPIHIQNTADSVHILDNTLVIATGLTHISVQSGVTNCWIRGNDMNATTSVTYHIDNTAGAGILLEGNQFRGTAITTRFVNNPDDSGLVSRGNTYLARTITAAATIAIPAEGEVFHVTGNTNITNGITVNTRDAGRRVTLVFEGTPTVSDTGTSKLAGNFVAAGTTNDHDTLTLACDGTNWVEVSRSTN